MNILKLIFCSLLLLFAYGLKAQNNVIANPVSISSSQPITLKTTPREIFKRKGRFFFTWGYNRALFSNSDIHFKGSGYNFTIADVKATDQPVKLSATYINPGTITVPQCNYRIGYYINDKTFISLGEDHMKYAISKQSTRLTGRIDIDNNGGKTIGTYNNTEVLVGENGENIPNTISVIDSLKGGFVSGFEHCDGLNDVTVEIGRNEQLWISRNGRQAFSVLGAFGAGVVVPDTDADVLGYAPKHDMSAGKKAYHLAGYSCSLLVGFELSFFKNFFLQAKLKGGYMNLPDINTTVEGGKASQHFKFLESMVVMGYAHDFGKHRSTKQKK